jgi:hypothetical protein
LRGLSVNGRILLKFTLQKWKILTNIRLDWMGIDFTVGLL